MSELFSNLGIDGKLLFAQAANFLLVVWVLHRFVFKKILLFLEERKKGIKEGVELTEKAKLEMERIGEVRHRAMGKAKELAETFIIEAKTRGGEMEKEIVKKAREGAEGILIKAEQESERKKQDALRDAKAEIQDRAFVLAEKVLMRSFSREDEKRMGQDLVNELTGDGKEN
ncbi:MAG: F0F1 ATP synthase subunit B [bacterium]|nr:F0F1 ATP synthase subunit B [bacterium]